MKCLSNIQSVMKFLEAARLTGTVAFVPTMGVFHEGHLSLMQKAKAECDVVIVSLFVNPLQFGPKEDFNIYPRELSEDRKKAAAAGVDLLWTPSEKELFPQGFQTRIEVSTLSQKWEGISRPSHFQGVATIVAKFLHIVQPSRLYLGQKDYQQTCVIARMMADLHFKTKLCILPTVREKDGLAMSSRNKRLSAAERDSAPMLYRALQAAEQAVQAGERNSGTILRAAASVLKTERRMTIDYLALCDETDLNPLEQLVDQAMLLAAVKIGSLRLIDNLRLNARFR